MADLVSLAGGLLPSADQSAISVLRFHGTQRELIDQNSLGGSVDSLPLEDGDLVRVNAVRDYVSDEVKVTGEVMYPGSYSLEWAGTLRTLLGLAQSLPDTDLYYGRLYRTGPGGIQENRTFSPKEVLDGKANIALKANDRVVLYPFGKNLSDLNFDNFPNTVTLEGDIRYPGMYAWKPGMKLSDIFSAKNFLVDTNVQYAIVVRKAIGSNRETVETFSPQQVASGTSNLDLSALDQIRFFPKSINKPIEVSGAIKDSKVVQYYPGIGLIDVLRTVQLSGSPTDMKVYIYREGSQFAPSTAGANGSSPGVAPPIGVSSPEAAGASAAQSSPQPSAVPSGTASEAAPQQGASGGSGGQNQNAPGGATSSSTTVPGQGVSVRSSAQTPPQRQPAPTVVYLNDFLTKESVQTVPLQPGDRLVFAPVGPNEKAPQVVVRGQVENPGAYLWKPGMRLSDLLREAGGYTPYAYPQGLVLLRQSVAALQRQQLDRAQRELQIALQQNIAKATAGSQASAAQAAQVQIQAQQAQLKALQTEIASVLGRVSIQMPKTLKELVGSPEDLTLSNGDVIFVPTTPTFVQIIGDVFNPVTVAYRPGLKVKDYVALAGGPSTTAQLRDSYAILADGTIVSARQKGWSLFGPRTIENDPVTPGETIVIAQKPSTPNNILPIISQVASTVGSIASTALNVMAILKL